MAVVTSVTSDGLDFGSYFSERSLGSLQAFLRERATVELLVKDRKVFHRRHLKEGVTEGGDSAPPWEVQCLSAMVP